MCLSGCHIKESSNEAKSGSTAITESPFLKLKDEEKQKYLSEITVLAAKLDKRFEDGWLLGRNSRVLKTGYRVVKPEIKAAFALAYHDMIIDSNQNLSQNINSYVPYSKRTAFAYKWWSNSPAKESFEEESLKKQVYWMHESILDASELFWRIFEKDYGSKVNSVMVLAHDKEQDMVFNYMEKEGQPGTFSDQYVIWKNKKESRSL